MVGLIDSNFMGLIGFGLGATSQFCASSLAPFSFTLSLSLIRCTDWEY